MKTIWTIILSVLVVVDLAAQVYDDYIGAGHSSGVIATSSDAQSNPLDAMNGDGLDLDIRGASRFLASATMGYTIEDVQMMTVSDIPSWIDQQMALPPSNYTIPTVQFYLDLFEHIRSASQLMAKTAVYSSYLMLRYGEQYGLTTS